MNASYLCPEPYPGVNMEFLRAEEIRFFHFGIKEYKVSYFLKPFLFLYEGIICEKFSCHVYEL
jgi:hypothetical protein